MKHYITTIFVLALFLTPFANGVAHAQNVTASTNAKVEMQGDLNKDSLVNNTDVDIVIKTWGDCTSSPCTADLTGDRKVDGADLTIVLGNFTQQTPARDPRKPGETNSLEALRAKIGRINDAQLKNLYDRADLSAVAKERIRAAVGRLPTLNTNNTNSDSNRGPERERELIRIHLGNLVERLEKAVERMEQLIGRVESRMTKLNADGADVAASRQFVAQTKVELNAARTDISAIASVVDKAVIESNPVTARETLTKIRAQIESAKNHLEGARKNLMSAVTGLIQKVGPASASINTSTKASASVQN